MLLLATTLLIALLFVIRARSAEEIA